MPSLAELAPEYIKLFATCEIRPEKEEEVVDFVSHVLAGQTQYVEAEKETGVPWFVISLLHGLEAGFSFHTHLHNGDSLNRKTVNVPQNRPLHDPPYTWLDSAVDALKYDGFTTWTRWDVPGILYKIESYNGWGYRKHGIHSPYLWSYSNHYESGKYIADGVWSSTAVSKQVGAATALRYMTEKHIVSLKAVEA